jgi:hypothetical protein
MPKDTHRSRQAFFRAFHLDYRENLEADSRSRPLPRRHSSMRTSAQKSRTFTSIGAGFKRPPLPGQPLMEKTNIGTSAKIQQTIPAYEDFYHDKPSSTRASKQRKIDDAPFPYQIDSTLDEFRQEELPIHKDQTRTDHILEAEDPGVVMNDQNEPHGKRMANIGIRKFHLTSLFPISGCIRQPPFSRHGPPKRKSSRDL